MNRKEMIVEQLQLTLDKSYWFVSFDKAVAGLTAEQAKWKNNNGENTIWQIISHLVFWNERYLDRFKGVAIQAMEGNNDTTFTVFEELEWEVLLDRFHTVMEEWIIAIRDCEDIKLDTPVQKESPATWLETLMSISLHTSYHIGQIITIRKMQGSWSKEQGVS